MPLKAYSFSENESLNMGIHDKVLFEQEKLLASEFVEGHPCRAESAPCPFCESGDTERFAAIGGAMYLRCKNCWSLFVAAGREILAKYQKYTPLINFRASEKYQETARLKREAVWRKQLFWVEFRSARYLKPLSGLGVVEIFGRYKGFSELAKQYCASYEVFNSADEAQGQADIILYLGSLTFEPEPLRALRHMRRLLKRNGLLFLDSRVGTGFDILTLKGMIDNIFPYEHAILPSTEALELILKKAGFGVLEISTPGTLDMRYVMENSSKLERGDLFTRYLVEKSDDRARSEFQRFLQKNTVSSYAQLVARVE